MGSLFPHAERLEAHLGTWVVRSRWWLIIATFLVVFAAAGGIRHLTFDNNLRVFFSPENPQLQALEALEDTYIQSDNVFFIIAPKNGDIFARDALMAMEELTEAAWGMPYSNRVDSLTNFQHTWADGDELFVEDLVKNAEGLSDADRERIKRIALSEPMLVNRLTSPSGHVAGVNINVIFPESSVNGVTEVVEYAHGMAKDFRKRYPGMDLYLTGSILFDNGFSEVSRDDMVTLGPVMFGVLVVIVGFSLRSVSGTLATLVVILMAVATGMGLAGWLGISLTPASAAAPTIVLTMAVADSVHILATMFRQMRLGRPKHQAVEMALGENLRPVFLTSLTTTIGFLSMNFSDAPPFRDLGNIVAMGVVAAFVYSVLFLPALMAVLPVRIGRRPGAADCPACDEVARFVMRRCRPVFWTLLVIIIALTAGTTQIELNDNWPKNFDERYDLRLATDFMAENLTGTDIIEYSLSSGEPGGINNPEYLETLEAFAAWYRGQPKVAHINVFTETIKRLNKNMHGDDESYYRIPDRRELAAQYLLLYELSLPMGLDLNNQVNIDKSATRMIVLFRDMSTRELRMMDDRARQWLKANAPESMFTYGSGLSVIWAHISHRNINRMLGASFGALIIISGLLVFAFRSLKMGLLSIIPNMAPALMAFGIWGMWVGQVGLGLSVIASMSLGIVVDDTVHFMSQYLRARRELGMDSAGSIRYAFNTVGTALWVTTLALVAGFLVLTFSGYQMTAEMGLLTAITITLALGLDFFFLPTLLLKADGRTVILSRPRSA